MNAILPTIAATTATARKRLALDVLLTELEAIYADLRRLEREFEPRLADYAEHKESARNLVHYLALRRRDIRQLQEQLAALGLSSLGRTESHVLAAIEAVLNMLYQLAQRARHAPAGDGCPIGFAEGKCLLDANTDGLLGPPPRKRSVRIMVTMPGEAADDFQLVRQLVANGMDCMRINCAHDDRHAWGRMVAHLQRAKRELGRECRVEMDLTGPKLRTGSIDARTQIVKWRPQRDPRGAVTRAAEIWLTPAENPELPRDVPLAHSRGGARKNVMIARGDLAVECGWERLAEAQEEILWICEAAHVPVIWATQVLESLAKNGAPSCAEITDAAMGERAECVMLNKGPHLVQAVRVLDNILQRMEAHQSKKSPRLRRLHLSAMANGRFSEIAPGA